MGAEGKLGNTVRIAKKEGPDPQAFTALTRRFPDTKSGGTFNVMVLNVWDSMVQSSGMVHSYPVALITGVAVYTKVPPPHKLSLGPVIVEL